MVDFHSKKFQLVWAAWILTLGVSLFFIHTIQNVHSFSEYLRAFAALDLPSSWCPTFLTLYGTSALVASLLGGSTSKKAFTVIAQFSGLVLLPVGILATATYTLDEAFRLDPMYLYAQTIHISEVLTGLLTISLLAKAKRFLGLALLLICGSVGIFLVVKDIAKDKGIDMGGPVTGSPPAGVITNFSPTCPLISRILMASSLSATSTHRGILFLRIICI